MGANTPTPTPHPQTHTTKSMKRKSLYSQNSKLKKKEVGNDEIQIIEKNWAREICFWLCFRTLIVNFMIALIHPRIKFSNDFEAVISFLHKHSA